MTPLTLASLLLLALNSATSDAITAVAVPAGPHEVLVAWTPVAGASYRVLGQSGSTTTLLAETEDLAVRVPSGYHHYVLQTVLGGHVIDERVATYCVGVVGWPPSVEIHECASP